MTRKSAMKKRLKRHVDVSWATGKFFLISHSYFYFTDDVFRYKQRRHNVNDTIDMMTDHGRMSEYDTGTMTRKSDEKKSPRDVNVDVSWATGKFFSCFIPISILLTKLFRY
jgi:hypothetical protein